AVSAESRRVAEALTAVRPTILPAVPRIYEKIHAGVLDRIEHESGVKRSLGLWALDVGARARRLRRAGEAVPTGLRVQERIADKLVFAKVKERLGGRLRVGVSG